MHGVEFMWTSEIFRIINKRYYPYLSFLDQSKTEYDGLVVAQGAHQLNIKPFESLSTGITPPNVFSPYKNKN